MKIEDLDVPGLRRHLETFSSVLRTDHDLPRVRQAAINIAGSITPNGGPLANEANKLPPVPSRVSQNVRLEQYRNEAFDAAIEHFIVSCKAAIDEIEAIQARIIENAGLVRKECRRRLLEFIVNEESDIQWSPNLSIALGLSQKQVLDALEHLESVGAIEVSNRAYPSPDEEAWRFRVTSRGRDLADGTVEDATTGSQFTLIAGSQIGVVGQNYGDVTQTNTISNLPDLPDDVLELLNSTPHGRVLADTFDEERSQPEPRRNRLRQIGEGIKSAIEAARVGADAGQLSADIASHAHAWFTTLCNALGVA